MASSILVEKTPPITLPEDLVSAWTPVFPKAPRGPGSTARKSSTAPVKKRPAEYAPAFERIRVVLLFAAVLALSAQFLSSSTTDSGARRNHGDLHSPDSATVPGQTSALAPVEEVEEEEEAPDVVRDLVDGIRGADYRSAQDVATGRALKGFLEEAALLQKMDSSTLDPYGKSSRFTLLRKAEFLSPSGGHGEFLLLEFVWTGAEWKLEHVEIRRHI